MATAHRTDAGQRLVVVKGDPREVLDLCRWHLRNGAVAALEAADRRTIIGENSRMAGEARRVLGVAFRSDDADGSGLNFEKRDFVWVCLVGMADPIRPEAPGLIDIFRHAGITSVMLTGEQRSTAAAVAAEMGLSDGRRSSMSSSSTNMPAASPGRETSRVSLHASHRARSCN
jgi:P-type Ca2+ transporter type 2C